MERNRYIFGGQSMERDVFWLWRELLPSMEGTCLSLSLSLGAASVMEGMHSLISWRRAMFRCCFGKETSV